MAKPTNRELMLDALNHRYSGRFPTGLLTRQEPKQALMRHYGVDDFQEVLDILGISQQKRVSINDTVGEFMSNK
jgi:hypothetical protein